MDMDISSSLRSAGIGGGRIGTSGKPVSISTIVIIIIIGCFNVYCDYYYHYYYYD